MSSSSGVFSVMKSLNCEILLPTCILLYTKINLFLVTSVTRNSWNVSQFHNHIPWLCSNWGEKKPSHRSMALVKSTNPGVYHIPQSIIKFCVSPEFGPVHTPKSLLDNAFYSLPLRHYSIYMRSTLSRMTACNVYNLFI